MSDGGELVALDHVIVAVRDLDAAAATYARLFGRAPSGRGEHPDLGTANASWRLENAYLELLKRDGTLTLVGAPETPLPVSAFSLLFRRRQLAGSIIGSLRETQEMLDFCAEREITADVEVIPIQKVNEAYDRMVKSDVKYRFVIDMASLKPS